MPNLCGRRRNLGSDRWIEYHAVYRVGGASIDFALILNDAVGACTGWSGELPSLPGDDAEELVRAVICEYIDTTAVPDGKAPGLAWQAFARSERL
jgi:hypothetical protein